MLVHGLGDHGLRYAHVAEALVEAGFGVAAPDLQGHGESGGRRGDVRDFSTFPSDLGSVVRRVRRGLPEEAPLVLLGHSMGGLVVLRYLQGEGRGRPGMPGPAGTSFGPPRGVTGAVLSAPWLRTMHPLPLWKRWAGELLLRTSPGIRLRGRVRPEQLSRDPAIRREREADPLVHDLCSPRLFRGAEEAQQRALDEAPGLMKVPLLLVVPEADGVADPRASGRLAQRLPPGVCTVLRIRDGVHEPLHDSCRAEVVRRIVEWVTDPSSREEGSRENMQRIG